MSGGFRHLDHMTDALIEAYGSTLDAAFENSARGLVNTMFDLVNVSPDTEVKIEAWGHDLCSLFYDWLEKVMLVVLTDNIILSDFKVKISCADKTGDHHTCILSATAKGEPLDLAKHHYKVEIKGVTYHEMQIKVEKEKNIVTTRFLLDL
ncbi:MAG TPA: archease [Nitrososphaeraceae archaeon]|nr:archease [Nitrososphaeraceae archaeon]